MCDTAGQLTNNIATRRLDHLVSSGFNQDFINFNFSHHLWSKCNFKSRHWSSRITTFLLLFVSCLSAAMHHLEEQTRLNQVEGPSGLFYHTWKQDATNSSMIWRSEKGSMKVEDARARGGVKEEGWMDGWETSRLPSYHQYNQIMQLANKKRHAITIRHLIRHLFIIVMIIIIFFFKTIQLVSLQLARKYKNHNFRIWLN